MVISDINGKRERNYLGKLSKCRQLQGPSLPLGQQKGGKEKAGPLSLGKGFRPLPYWTPTPLSSLLGRGGKGATAVRICSQ
ncbi:hypothetical protein HMPREF0262_03153 [Clostridium sp. ATCC 29733]|nr:hypothetical protein HMPREF0262_03153 [Clostridium sp. ATCC 29733]